MSNWPVQLLSFRDCADTGDRSANDIIAAAANLRKFRCVIDRSVKTDSLLGNYFLGNSASNCIHTTAKAISPAIPNAIVRRGKRPIATSTHAGRKNAAAMIAAICRKPGLRSDIIGSPSRFCHVAGHQGSMCGETAERRMPSRINTTVSAILDRQVRNGSMEL
jgi:hypothetical protein